MADRTKVIGYVRVSLETMADHGVSLDAQRAKKKPTSAWTGCSPSERAAGLVAHHDHAIEKARAEARSKGTPDHWSVSTTWSADLDAPISLTAVGPPDPAAQEKLVDALAEFLVDVWMRRREEKASPDRSPKAHGLSYLDAITQLLGLLMAKGADNPCEQTVTRSG